MKTVGVCPLVCAVCESIVGVINEGALAAMLAEDDIYICHACEEQDETQVAHVLEMQPRGHYASMVGQALVDGRVTPSVNVYG